MPNAIELGTMNKNINKNIVIESCSDVAVN